MEPLGIDVFLAEHVVQHHAEPRRHVATALAVGDRQARDVAGPIPHADVGGTALLGEVPQLLLRISAPPTIASAITDQNCDGGNC